MGIEAELKREIRMTEMRRAILSTISAAGIISLGLLAPKVLSGLVNLRAFNRRKDERVRSAVNRLVEKGLLEKDGERYRLSHRGEAWLEKSTLSVKRPAKWDWKWRLVTFDIPNARTPLRNLLRENLRQIGFLRLQDSVWIYPFDCEELITLLRTRYRLGKEVQYMIVDKIERDLSIRRHFDLT